MSELFNVFFHIKPGEQFALNKPTLVTSGIAKDPQNMRGKILRNRELKNVSGMPLPTTSCNSRESRPCASCEQHNRVNSIGRGLAE